MLPSLSAGIYRHYKGHYYQVFGYAHDANADTLYHLVYDPTSNGSRPQPMRERTVVVYMGIQVEDAHTGPRLAVRSVDDFFMLLHQSDFTPCQVAPRNAPVQCPHGHNALVRRFEYHAPEWTGPVD